MVVDVGEYLTGVHYSKMDKYAPILLGLQEQLRAVAGVVLAVVVGTRGQCQRKWLKCPRNWISLTVRHLLLLH